MKGSFLIKASDLLTKNSIFHGAVVLKVGDKEYLEKGVLFLTPKGFNIRFLLKTKNMEEAEVFTVFLGNKFDKDSLKYYEEGFDPDSTEGIFSFNFDLGFEMFNAKENYNLTKLVYPANKRSFYYESRGAQQRQKTEKVPVYGKTSNGPGAYYIFDSETVVKCIGHSCGWTTIVISKAQLINDFAKIDQTLQVNTSKFTKQSNESIQL